MRKVKTLVTFFICTVVHSLLKILSLLLTTQQIFSIKVLWAQKRSISQIFKWIFVVQYLRPTAVLYCINLKLVFIHWGHRIATFEIIVTWPCVCCECSLLVNFISNTHAQELERVQVLAEEVRGFAALPPPLWQQIRLRAASLPQGESRKDFSQCFGSGSIILKTSADPEWNILFSTILSEIQNK